MSEQKIILGDAYKLIKLVEDNSIDLIITDPPYEIEGIHGGSDIARSAKAYNEIADGGLDKGIDLSILNDFVRVMKKINIYIWCNKEQIYNYMTFFVKERKCNFDILIWAKENPIPFCGTHYLCDKEYCLYFWETGADLYVPYERGRTYWITKTNKADKEDFGHPTIKPIEFIETMIKNSVGGGLNKMILDPFIGSGTTALAAKHLDINCLGFEINEKYCTIACDRLRGINKKGEINLFDFDYESDIQK